MPIARRLKAPASLGAKLVLILTGVGVIGAVALTLMLATVITPSFSKLEHDAVDAHVARTQAVVHDVSAKVELAVRDYGDWTSSYDYMANPTRAFEKESFSTLAMVNLDVNAMAYVRPDRSIVIARWLDLEKQADVPAMRARLTDAIGRLDFAKVLAASKEKNSTGFFLRLGDTLVAMGIAQVRRPAAGRSRWSSFPSTQPAPSQSPAARSHRSTARASPAHPPASPGRASARSRSSGRAGHRPWR